METYCVSCTKYTANENSHVKINRLMLLSNCAVCGKKKSIFVKNKDFSNKIINKFLLIGDNFMPKLHLKQPGFT